MKTTALLSVLASVCCCTVLAADGAPIPPFKLWSDVKSPELKDLHAPKAERFALDNGMVVFLLEDHELPLIDLSLRVRVRGPFEPPALLGLVGATAGVMRSGGSEKYPGDKLDEILENMAASVNFSIDSDSGYGSLSVLKQDFDKGLDIFVDVLRNPAFPEEKLELWRTQARTGIAKRNDSPNSIVGREFHKALYGADSPFARHTEYVTVNAIDRAAVQAFHKKYFHPNQFILGVYGDFKKDEMLAKLKAAFANWPAEQVELPAVPPISTERSVKTLYVDRPKINQTTFMLGQVVDMRRNSPDYPAIQMMNDILSGSMSARMFTEVRTKKGLAYSVWGFANVPYDRPGVFSCTALTRNEQALEAVDAVRFEVRKLVEHGVTPEEVAESRERIINSFVFNFDTPDKIVGRQMTYEYFGYPMDFAEKLLEAIKQVTAEDVNRVAKKYIDPDKFVLIGVGNSAELDAAKSFKSLKDVQLVDVTIPPAPLGNDAKRTEEGRRILADAVKAAGGADALKAVASFREDVVFASGGGRIPGCVRAKLPDSLRVDLAAGGGAITEILSGENAWTAQGDKVRDTKAAQARKNLRPVLESDLELLQAFAAPDGLKIQALDPLKDGERTLEGAAVESAALGRLKVWCDAQSHLLASVSKIGADGVQKEAETQFSGHTAYGNLTLAKSVVDKSGDTQQRMEIQTLQFNPALDAALFSKPEKATAPEKQ